MTHNSRMTFGVGATTIDGIGSTKRKQEAKARRMAKRGCDLLGGILAKDHDYDIVREPDGTVLLGYVSAHKFPILRLYPETDCFEDSLGERLMSAIKIEDVFHPGLESHMEAVYGSLKLLEGRLDKLEDKALSYNV